MGRRTQFTKEECMFWLTHKHVDPRTKTVWAPRSTKMHRRISIQSRDMQRKGVIPYVQCYDSTYHLFYNLEWERMQLSLMDDPMNFCIHGLLENIKWDMMFHPFIKTVERNVFLPAMVKIPRALHLPIFAKLNNRAKKRIVFEDIEHKVGSTFRALLLVCVNYDAYRREHGSNLSNNGVTFYHGLWFDINVTINEFLTTLFKYIHSNVAFKIQNKLVCLKVIEVMPTHEFHGIYPVCNKRLQLDIRLNNVKVYLPDKSNQDDIFRQQDVHVWKLCTTRQQSSYK